MARTHRRTTHTQKKGLNDTNKGLNDPDNHNGVITHLKQDILECEVKWALGSIMNKDSGGDGIPAELFQNLKYDYAIAALLVKNPPAMQETWVQSLGWEDPLGKGKATHYSILAMWAR